MSTNMGKSKIETCVEKICNKGCLQVRQDILRLECGKSLPEMADLSGEERLKILSELKTIMAVYGDSCRIC